MDVLLDSLRGVASEGLVGETVVIPWPEYIEPHYLPLPIQPQVLDLLLLDLSLVPRVDSEEVLLDLHDSQAHGLHHGDDEGRFGFVEVDFGALEDLHVVHLQQVRLEDLQRLEVAAEVQCFDPHFVAVFVDRTEVDWLPVCICELRSVVVEGLLQVVREDRVELWLEADVEPR